MNNNRLKFWLYLAVVILLYSGFLTYFCMARPSEPNNIIIEQEKISQPVDTIETSEEESSTQIEDVNKTIDDLPWYDKKVNKQNINQSKSVGPVYLSEITAFYERIITILSIIIGLILGLNFLYLHHTSRNQAEDMARDSLKTESFQIILKNRIATGADEFINRYSKIPDLEKRIEFLEEQLNIQGYELSDEVEDEVNDGNN